MKNTYLLRDTMRILLITAAVLALSGCATQSAMPLGNDMMQIDVSAAPIYGRAGAMQMAYQTAAKATIKAGYDKFIVVGDNGWNETTAGGASFGSFGANATPAYGSASGSYSSGWGTHRHPESSMIIHMFHKGDKGSAKAIDAQQILAQAQQQQQQ